MDTGIIPARTPAQRRAALGSNIAEADAEALLVSSPANVRYLSGFTGEGLLLCLADGSAAVSTDSRYELVAGRDCPDCELILHRDGHLAGASDSAHGRKLRTLLFESEMLSYAHFSHMTAQLPQTTLLPALGMVEELRLIKDAGEVRAISRAAAIVDHALAELFANLGPGPTEKAIALDLERAILLGGAEGIAFYTIVAAGHDAAFPHAVPSGRKLVAGQMLTIDVGGKLNGYCSDITRTPFFPREDKRGQARYEDIYNLALEAQLSALAAVRPGILCADVDAVARRIIVAAGHGAHFGHGLGHGVGLEVHEGPRVSMRSEIVLQPGMVITIEPGIYIEGWGGVRIEDLVLVTRDGCRILTRTPK